MRDLEWMEVVEQRGAADPDGFVEFARKLWLLERDHFIDKNLDTPIETIMADAAGAAPSREGFKPVQAADDRTAAIWAQGSIDGNPFTLDAGDTTQVNVRLSIVMPAHNEAGFLTPREPPRRRRTCRTSTT